MTRLHNRLAEIGLRSAEVSHWLNQPQGRHGHQQSHDDDNNSGENRDQTEKRVALRSMRIREKILRIEN